MIECFRAGINLYDLKKELSINIEWFMKGKSEFKI